MRTALTIRTTNAQLFDALKSTAPEGVSVSKIIGFAENSGFLGIVIEFGKEISKTLVSSWLSKKMKKNSKGKGDTITINRVEIYLDKGDITHIIEEIIIKEGGK